MTTKFPNAFRFQLAATTISNIGDGMVSAAAPLLALSLTSDPRLISGVSFASSLPWLVLSLPAGVYIDRLNRKTLMISVNAIRAVLFSVIAICAATSNLTIWWFMFILVGVGACEVIFDMSGQAFLPQIIPEPLLEKANGRLYSAEVVANGFIGLPVGAWAFVVAVGVPFGVNAAALAIAAVLVSRIRVPIHSPSPTKLERTPSFIQDLKQGIAWLKAHPLLRTLAIMLGITNMASMFGGSILVKYAADVLNVTGRSFGLLLSVLAVGSIIGGLIGDRIAKLLGAGPAILLSYTVFSASGLVYVFAPHVWSVVLVITVYAVASMIWNIVTVSLRQRIIPVELFGRVNSVYRFVGSGSIALGALIGGQIAYRYGIKAPFMAAVIVGFITLAWGAPRILRATQSHGV
ncbi:MAG: MFS transporter [Ilumatobacteraceae bacterium]